MAGQIGAAPELSALYGHMTVVNNNTLNLHHQEIDRKQLQYGEGIMVNTSTTIALPIVTAFWVLFAAILPWLVPKGPNRG